MNAIKDEASLRALIGEPAEIIRKKVTDRLNRHSRQLIERSPFLCLATSDADGCCDVSPRGDAPGFVRIVDERTLLIPERPGNKLADSLRNILVNPRVGMLFVIPGIGDSFRVNGRATLIADEELLRPSSVEGKIPRLGILVEIEEAFTQCSKAFLRSQLWDPSRHIDRSQLPSSGEIMAEIVGGDFDAEKYDCERAARYARREGFY
jgi:PPOX class probable FMN-dependent enzyme